MENPFFIATTEQLDQIRYHLLAAHWDRAGALYRDI